MLISISCSSDIRQKSPAKQPLLVTHLPNPTDKYSSDIFKDPPYKNMWFYETKVKNLSDRELKVIWFESYFKTEEGWYASNVTRETLRNDVFKRWYGDNKNSITDGGWLLPGKEALCKVNWHYSETPDAQDVKWSFIAIDRFGNDYYVEKVITSVPQQ